MTTSMQAGLTSADVVAVSPVVPVVVIEDAAQAVPLARALVRGGIGVIEITRRPAAGLAAIAAVAEQVPEIVTGAGTVTTPAQVAECVAAGAQFLVTPGTTPTLLDAVLAAGVPTLPGAATVSESLRLAELGFTVQKFFPAEPSGGRLYLASLTSPLPGLSFCPTGGISPATAPDYLALPNVPCVGGSWLTPADALAAGDWDRIEELARSAAALG